MTWFDQMGGVSLSQDGVAVADGNKITKFDFVGATIAYNVATRVAQISISSITSLPPVSNGKIIGRYGAGTGTAQEVSVGGGLEITSGGVLQAADDSVDLGKLQNIGIGLLGNDTGTNNPKLVPLGAGLQFVAGALAVAAFAVGSLSPIANNRVLGNVSGSSAAPSELTGAQVVSMLPDFVASGASHARGVVPDPGSSAGTTRFLCEDGTWKVTSGSITGPSNPGDNNKLAYASAGNFAYAAQLKTDGTYLSITASGAVVAGSGLTRYPHNPGVALVAAIGSDGITTYPLLTWGSGSNNKLTIGDTTVPLIETKASQTKLTLSSQNATALTAGHTITGGSHLALSASTEVQDILFDLAQTKQWATGALATQRAFRIAAPTYGFVGASILTTAATVAISGAPTAGTNATINQSLALWIENGSIGYGTSAAQSGLNRIAQNVVYLAGRSSTSTDVNLIRWGTATDQLALGDDGAASVLASAATSFILRLGAAPEWTFTASQLDANNNNIVNLNAINGVRVASGVLGAALADANETLSVSGGSVYEQTIDLTGNRSKALGITGSPKDRQVISIRRYTTAAFTMTITDEVGNVLFVFPASLKGIADFQFSSATNKFVLVGYMPLS